MTVKFRINGVEVEAEAGTSLLDAIRHHGFEVPSLCHHEALTPYGACRLCLVEIAKGGRKKITTSCNYEVLPDIEVATDSPDIRRHRALVLELLLAEAPENPVLRALAGELGVVSSRFGRESDAAIHADRGGCILCGLCVRVCDEIVGVGALGFSGRGDKRGVGGPYMQDPQACIACGACAWACPTDCIGFVQEDGLRKLKKWKRELPLELDADGRPVAPKFQLYHFKTIARLADDFYKKAPGNR